MKLFEEFLFISDIHVSPSDGISRRQHHMIRVLDPMDRIQYELSLIKIFHSKAYMQFALTILQSRWSMHSQVKTFGPKSSLNFRLGWLRGSKPNKMAYAKLQTPPRVVTVPTMRLDSHHVTQGDRFLGQKITIISKIGSKHIGLHRFTKRDLYLLVVLVPSYNLRLVSSVQPHARSRDGDLKMALPPNYTIFSIQVMKLFLLTQQQSIRIKKSYLSRKLRFSG